MYRRFFVNFNQENLMTNFSQCSTIIRPAPENPDDNRMTQVSRNFMRNYEARMLELIELRKQLSQAKAALARVVISLDTQDEQSDLLKTCRSDFLALCNEEGKDATGTETEVQ
jgi:hypothetical protein